MGRPLGDLLQRIQDRGDGHSGARGLIAGLKTVKDENPRFCRKPQSQRQRFIDMGDEEIAAARLQQDLRDDIRAETICIGLDDRCRLRCGRHGRKGQIIVAQCAEIDGQMTACTTGGLLAADLHVHGRSPSFLSHEGIATIVEFLGDCSKKMR